MYPIYSLKSNGQMNSLRSDLPIERKEKVGQHKRKTTKSIREFLDKLIFWRGALRIETALHKGIFTLSQRWS